MTNHASPTNHYRTIFRSIARFSGVAILLLRIGVGSLVLVACVERPQTASPQKTAVADSLRIAAIPDQESEDARIFFYDGPQKSADIRATYIRKFSRLDSTWARELEVDFYDSSGQIATHMIADSGCIKEERNIMVGFGHVVVISADSSRLESDELTWNNNTQMITSSIFVTLISDGDTLSGVGFESDRNLRKIKILKQARGTLSSNRMAR